MYSLNPYLCGTVGIILLLLSAFGALTMFAWQEGHPVTGEVLAWLSVWSKVQMICIMVQLMPLPRNHVNNLLLQ